MMSEILAGFIGAFLALLGQGIWERARKAWLARRLALAFREELCAVEFDPSNVPRIGGFSSQTFDTLFRDMAEALPDSLIADLMRYHLRMKLLVAHQERHGTVGPLDDLQELPKSRDLLVERLDRYAARDTADLIVSREES